jgi:hypothetical protein
MHYASLHGFFSTSYPMGRVPRTVYAVPIRVLASKGGVAGPDKPCHCTLVPMSSSSSQLVGPQLNCLEPRSRVHPTVSAGVWIPWALLRLILKVLSPCKCTFGQLTPGTFREGDVVKFDSLIPVFWPGKVSSAMSIGEDGLHKHMLQSAQGH